MLSVTSTPPSPAPAGAGFFSASRFRHLLGLEGIPRQEILEMPHEELGRLIQTLEEEMHEAAADLRFEYAARLRDEINDLKRELREAG